MTQATSIVASSELGSLGVPHLKRLWSAAIAEREGTACDRPGELDADFCILNALKIGRHQSIRYLIQASPTFAEFEDWIVATAGSPDPLTVARLQSWFCADTVLPVVHDWLRSIADQPPVLSEADLQFWDEHGYVVLRDALSPTDRRLAEQAIWDHIGADSHDQDSWYGCKNTQGIMVELIQHPALQKNRESERIHKAFSQLWGTADIWASADRCGFHPPQSPTRPFPGPDLHWDLDFDEPLGFGTQGIVYLTDTPPKQGALTLVPGFHKKLESWLTTIPPETDPHLQDLHALGPIPVGANAGDMIIWHHALPHGSRPNLGTQPRIVQYINMRPCDGMQRKA